jgi:membrane protein
MEKIQIKRKLKDIFKITKNSALNFGSNNPTDLAGTTAYFASFSMAPILIIIISLFGLLVGDDAMRTKLFEELNGLIGSESSHVLQDAIDNYEISKDSHIGTILGVIFFLVSATTLFGIMQSSINYIWRVQVKSNIKMNILKLLRDRVFSFGVILGLGFLMLVSLIIDATIAFLRAFLSSHFGPDLVILAQIINLIISLGIVSSIFTFIYRYLPDVKVQWNAAWFAGIFTAILFSIGKIAIGMIIGSSNMGVVYGAIGSFIIILIWIYYASFIFYFGVELSRQYSLHYKHNNEPLNFAVPFRIILENEDGEKIEKSKEHAISSKTKRNKVE